MYHVITPNARVPSTPPHPRPHQYIAFLKERLEGQCDEIFANCMEELATTLSAVFTWRLLVMGNFKEVVAPAMKRWWVRADVKLDNSV